MKRNIIKQNEEMQKFITDCFGSKNMIQVGEHVEKILKTQSIKTIKVDGVSYVRIR